MTATLDNQASVAEHFAAAGEALNRAEDLHEFPERARVFLDIADKHVQLAGLASGLAMHFSQAH